MWIVLMLVQDRTYVLSDDDVPATFATQYCAWDAAEKSILYSAASKVWLVDMLTGAIESGIE